LKSTMMLTASSGRAIRSTFKICVTDNPMHSQMIYGVKKYQGGEESPTEN
jgi:hypothetical protein